MRFLLDSNAWVSYLRQNDANVMRRFDQAWPDEIALCSIVIAELLYGAHHSAASKQAANFALIERLQAEFVSLAFDDIAAAEYGRVRDHRTKQGTPIGPNDLMIASIALANDLVVVTHKTREFGRVPGLQFEDWQGHVAT